MKDGALSAAVLAVILCASAPAMADVAIDPTLTGVKQIVLDYDRDTGNYFVVVRGQDTEFYLRVYISTDSGASWSRTSTWIGNPEYVDIDATVAGNYLYVGIVQAGSSSAVIRRFSTNDGSDDIFYSGRIVIYAFPADIVDIALASNQDGADTEIYYAAISDDGALRFFYDSSSDGTTFEELSPPISDACCGLDMTFNPQSLDHDVLFSYFDLSLDPHIWRSFPWEEVVYFSAAPDSRLTSRISAHGDSVVVCIEFSPLGTTEYGVFSWITHNAFDQRYGSYAQLPTDGEGNYYGCDVTARGGRGFAMAYTHEEGAFDPVYLRRHTGPLGSPWDGRVAVNSTDTAAANNFRTSLSWLPPDHYGIAHVGPAGSPYFVRISIPLADGFESGDTSAWSSTVP